MIRRAIPRTSALSMLAATRFTATRAMATTNYRSTRGGQQGLTFEQAVMQGLATDRGLLVPENLPQFPAGGVEAFRGLSYEALALEIMSLYIGPDDIPKAELKDIIDRSYGTFRDRDVTPVVPLGVDGLHVLELFHGPTFAFKDVALQYLGNTFEHLLKKTPGASITVVGATSGDTGSSAIYGLRGKKGVECFIMFPDGRVPLRRLPTPAQPSATAHSHVSTRAPSRRPAHPARMAIALSNSAGDPACTLQPCSLQPAACTRTSAGAPR